MGTLRRLQFAFVVLMALGLSVRPAAAGVGVWTPLGPDGGSVWAMAVDPDDADVVYAGTRNGVFKSTDAGATWVSASKGLPVSRYAVPSVGVLAADPRFPNRIWATAGRGVFLSTDGGQTWQARRNGLPSDTFARGLVLAPDGKTLYLVNQKAVFKTTDQGKKWTRVNKGFSTEGALGELVLDPANQHRGRRRVPQPGPRPDLGPLHRRPHRPVEWRS